MINLYQLTTEQREKWGTCPVCQSEPGQQCKAAQIDDLEQQPPFTHIARLVNAPEIVVREE